MELGKRRNEVIKIEPFFSARDSVKDSFTDKLSVAYIMA